MSHHEFNRLLESINALTPQQMRQLSRELEGKMAAAPAITPSADDPLIGSMSDHVELMDQIVEDATRHREQQPWRITVGE